MTTPPFKVYFNPRGASWFNSVEWVNSYLKAHISKAFARNKLDVKSLEQFYKLLWSQLLVVR